MTQLDLFGGDDADRRDKYRYWEGANGDGATCPVCLRYGRVYRRRLNSGMASWLLLFYRHCRDAKTLDYVDVRLVKGGIELAHKREFEKLAYWGLIEKRPGKKEDGHASGFWKLTEVGVAFALCRHNVWSHALDYNGGCRGLTGDPISIRQALRNKFDYDDLMNLG